MGEMPGTWLERPCGLVEANLRRLAKTRTRGERRKGEAFF
jgi:hypothetical protein